MISVHSASRPLLIEICVEGIEGLVAAQAAGADRIELCAALSEGGLTPSAGTVRRALQLATIPVHVMIRPRGGDFLYSPAEFDSMLIDASLCAEAGASGVVGGFLEADGSIDESRTRAFVEASGGATVTFHRAFDMTRDPIEALETLVRCRISHVLTSGQQPTAEKGAAVLRELCERAAGRITIIGCGGVRAENLAALRRATGLREFHCGPLTSMPSGMHFRNPSLSMGGDDPDREYRLTVSDTDAIRTVVQSARFS